MDSRPRKSLLSPAQLSAYREVIALFDAIQPGTAEFGACLLLLDLRREVQSVDRLAARLGLSRHIVAQCMRRLVDSGVVEGRRLICAWGADPLDPQSFQADLNVALGRWVRWADEFGTLHWAEAGAVFKKYDYQVGPEDVRNRTHFLDVALPDRAGLQTMKARLPAPEPRWLGGPVAAAPGVLPDGVPDGRDERYALSGREWGSRLTTGEVLYQRTMDAVTTDVVWLA